MKTSICKFIFLYVALVPAILFAQADEDILSMAKNQDFNKTRLDSIYAHLKNEQASYSRDSLIAEVFYLDAARLRLLQKLDSVIITLNEGLTYVANQNPKKANYYEFLGTSIYRTGDVAKALLYYDTTLALAEKFENLYLQITMLNRSSVLYNELGNREMEIEMLKRAITIADSSNSNDHQGTIRVNLGIAFMESGMLESAIETITESLGYIENVSDSNSRAIYFSYAYSNLADMYGSLKKHDTAIFLSSKALEYTSEEDLIMRAYIANSLAGTYQDLQQFSKAKEQLEYAYPILSNSQIPSAKMGVASSYANVLIHTGDYELAEQVCYDILPYADSVRKFDMLAGIHHCLARALMYQNKVFTADEEFGRAFDYRDSVRIQYQDEAVANLKVEHDLIQGELENKWLKEENKLKDDIIQSSTIIIILSILGLIVFGGFIIVINRNRKQLKLQQQELQEKNIALLDSNKNNERILSLIAHDVRGPLSSLETMIKFQQNDDAFTALETLTVAKGSISTLNNLVNSLLNWARKERGLSQLDPTSVFLIKEVSKIKDLYIHQLMFKEITFRVEIPEHTQLYADENMLHAVLRNLITNAIKFTPKGGEIKVSYASTSKFDEICISDNGIGISSENLALMKEGQISSQKGTNSELGTGLGILFVRDMMKAHSGELSIDSKEGKGSKFCLKFPKGKGERKNEKQLQELRS